MLTIEHLVSELMLPEKCDNAARELFRRKNDYLEIALHLWRSPTTITTLIIKIQSIYGMLSPPTLTQSASIQVCNILNLFQCVVSYPYTRAFFLRAGIPCYLYPFLNTRNTTSPFEYLRLSSLGVLKALVHENDAEGVKFLVGMHANRMDIISPCLRIMTIGGMLSKRLATYVLMKIILSNVGLAYICAKSNEEFNDANPEVIANILHLMLVEHATKPFDPQLLNYILRCYVGLCNDTQTREALRLWHPNVLQKLVFEVHRRGDVNTQNMLEEVRKFVVPTFQTS
jgi:CCR4-NOT transcription complex subunit 9